MVLLLSFVSQAVMQVVLGARLHTEVVLGADPVMVLTVGVYHAVDQLAQKEVVQTEVDQ